MNSHVSARSDLESLVAQVADEFLQRQQQGDSPDIEEFVQRYPEHALVLRQVLTALYLVRESSGGDGNLWRSPPEEPLAGCLGDFRILRELGRGGMGVVYEAEQLSLGRRVALKVLPFAALLHPRSLQRFENEARTAACLHHPNIVQVHMVGCERGVHYYAMQLIRGRNLAELVSDLSHNRQQPASPATQDDTPCESFPTKKDVKSARGSSSARGSTSDWPFYRTLAGWGAQAARALDHAHRVGIIHRDVKPANLLLDEEGQIWVTDFGLALLQSETNLTRTGDTPGTLRYMSPEQALGQRAVVDQRSDVYSLGATLYELATLRPATEGANRAEILRHLSDSEPVAPRKWNPAIPVELETILLKCLSRNPVERYATAQDLAEDLERFHRDEPILARPPGLVRRTRKWASRHRAILSMMAASLLLILLVLAGNLGWNWRERTARQARLSGQVEQILMEADHLCDKQQWTEALTVARQTTGLLDKDLLQPNLRDKARERIRQLRFVEQLDKASQTASNWSQQGFDRRTSLRLYGEAFHDFLSFDLGDSPERAREELSRHVTILEPIINSLDNWYQVMDHLGLPDPVVGKKLLNLADALDPEPLRVESRRTWTQPVTLALQGQVKELRKRMESGKPSAAILVHMAESLRRVALPEEQSQTLRKALQEHPDDFWINMIYANFLSRQKKHVDALPYARASVALKPASAPAWNNLGNQYHALKSMEEAMSCYRRATEVDDRFAMGYKNLGSALYELGRKDEALLHYRRAVEMDPGKFTYHASLAQVYRDLNQPQQSVDHFRKAIALEPRNALLYFDAAQSLKAKGDVGEADAYLRKGLEINPNHAIAWSQLGVLQVTRKNPKEAISCYQRAISLDPGHPLPHVNLGKLYQLQGRLEDAITCYRTAIRLDPNRPGFYRDENTNPASGASDLGPPSSAPVKFSPEQFAVVYLDLGQILPARKQWREAAVCLRHVKGVYSDEIFLQMLAQAEYRSGNYRGAMETLERLIASRPANPYDCFFIALTHHRLGDRSKAEVFRQKARSLLPSWPKSDPGLAALEKEVDHVLKPDANPKASPVGPSPPLLAPNKP